MPVKTIVYNFIKEQADIVKHLQEDGTIEIAEWFCYPPFGTVNITTFADVTYGLEDSYGLGEEVYDEVYRYLPIFLDMHQRRFPYFQNNLYDSIGDFNRQFGVVYRMLKKYNPRLVLFGNIPHGGHDYLLYRLARDLGIRTLVLFQVPVCPRFMILEDIDDFGAFEKVENGTAEDIGPLPEIKRPFYMRRKNLGVRGIYRFLKPLANPRKALPYIRKGFRYFRFHAQMRAATSFPQERLPYVYFPLHLQPEMTTSSLGGYYVDQMLAIERLSRKLPEGMRILVKENPKQNEYQRPVNFYRRLQALDNVVLVPIEMNTYDLIRDCAFVATVTGTAGWEAINLGKPALVFGKAWYETLPGVFKYTAGVDIGRLCGTAVDKAEVEKRYRILMEKSWPGIVSSPCFNLVPGADVQENNKKVASAIRSVIVAR